MQAQDLTGTPFLDLAFLIARVMIGLLMTGHGAQKLFGWFGGHGLKATGEFFGKLGFEPARLFATAAALGEFTSGLLIALGLFGPVGPAILLAVMVAFVFVLMVVITQLAQITGYHILFRNCFAGFWTSTYRETRLSSGVWRQ